MTATRPHDLPKLFARGLNAGDVDLVVSLYEPDGVVAPDAARVVAGQGAIRTMVESFLATRPRFRLRDSEIVETGDIALVRARWTMTTADSAGVTTEMELAPTLVTRRQPDGHWLVVVDRPLPGGGGV